MKSSSFIKNYNVFNNNIEPRNSSIELWRDILNYSSNLPGNWLLSKHIFYSNIVPTAERSPAKFALWIKEMVKKSGVKIKARSEFIKAINYLIKLEGKADRSGVKRALYHLFESGISDSACSNPILRNSA